MLMSVVGLLETSTGAPAPETSLESSSGKLLSLGVNGVEVAIMLSGLERVREPTNYFREGVLCNRLTTHHVLPGGGGGGTTLMCFRAMQETLDCAI